MLASLVLAAIAIPQQGTPLTYSTTAKRLDLIIAEIEAATGKELETTEDATNHYLVIAVADVPLQATLTKIANVTASQWVPGRDDVPTLMPDIKLRKEEASAAVELRAKRLYEEWADNEVTSRGQSHRFPDTPLTTIANQIGLTELAEIEEGERVVWSLTPTITQRRMQGTAIQKAIQTAIGWQMSAAPRQIQATELPPDALEAMAALGLLQAPDRPIAQERLRRYTLSSDETPLVSMSR